MSNARKNSQFAPISRAKKKAKLYLYQDGKQVNQEPIIFKQ